MAFAFLFRRQRAARPRAVLERRRLSLERLEDRCLLSITIDFDYSHDVNGFFNDPTRRALLNEAGTIIGSQLDDSLSAIVPGGGNTWSATFTDPGNGSTASIANLTVPANTLIVYVGGRAFPADSSEVG